MNNFTAKSPPRLDAPEAITTLSSPPVNPQQYTTIIQDPIPSPSPVSQHPLPSIIQPTSRPPTPATKSIPADHTSLQPPTNALFITDTIIPILLVMEVCDSSNDSGTDCHNFDSHHITVLNTTACIESKMDSLRTISESSSATIEIRLTHPQPYCHQHQHLSNPLPLPQKHLHNLTHHQHSPFKFLNIWADRIDFLPTVTFSWQIPVNASQIEFPKPKQNGKQHRFILTITQSAFLPGRNISDAILLTQELLYNYHHNKGPARCALKVDLKKAFDTVRLDYIIAGLHAIGLPPAMIRWISTCITTVHYTININGEMHGFFHGTRGIRQGDPLSPYLFVLAMEGLGGIIRQKIQHSAYKYHWRCKATKLTHLCFADDLMLFSHADLNSILIMKESLQQFSNISGLSINLAKSSLYLSGIDGRLRINIIEQIGIQETMLPVKYLGVPLLSSRLTHKDCIPLLERITTRIKLWTSSSLTYAGRLQLIKSVLFSIQVYWSSIFILPCATITKIESILAAFLWRGSSLTSTGAKVAWKAICYALQEGGLGVKNIKTWNRAATLKHIWHLLTDKESIWATWIHANLLRGRSLWHIPMPSNPSWSYRKIIQSREWCRGWFTTAIGNGSSTSLWFDYWLLEGKRLIDEYSMRTLTATGLSWTAQVSDIIKEGQWDFPQALNARLNSIPFQPKPWFADHCLWKGHSSGNFSINSAWESLRDRRPENTIHKVLWFKGHIPRQSFIQWLASLGRLHTMDRLQSNGIIRNATCIFYGLQTATHEHLFFECQFSRIVWQTINAKAIIHWPYLPWQNLLS
ncbi:hypothetical protein NC651_009874 [Populus alba x Populus x berolinensis]|nr:hypothetical protein NC651_009874 [Populus alba x Populus x berolinensis]